MSTTPLRVSPPLDEFIRDLLQFTHACGSPHYRELAKLAPEVLARHKKRIPVLRTLSLTAISNVMTRKRQGPQSWGWVATYVLTCLHYVEKTGITPDFPGPADLQGWHIRYQAMRDQLVRLPAQAGTEMPRPDLALEPAPQVDLAASAGASSAGAGTGDAELPAVPAVVLAAPPMGGGSDGLVDETRERDGRWTAPSTGSHHSPLPWQIIWSSMNADELGRWLPELPSRAHRRFYQLFSQHGVDLLDGAEHGDPDAACRLGILLLCHRRPAEAIAWLNSAARSGDEAAEVLINADPDQRQQLAAELAYEFTLPGYRQDRSESPTLTGAETYYQAAACAGHLGALARLGMIYEARGETASALFAFTEAAQHQPPVD
ncbi:hypothetical protein GCM10022254_37740 [Actinomadura meridiana]|uniref:Sel1 repeat family protein n=1 Tax=Actinomadura meridiana TaxID=559626 RepID=A0ABP8C5K0_9ACTN